MKPYKLYFLMALLTMVIACDATDDSNSDINSSTERVCGSHNGNTLYTGPRGGCYYYNSNDNKTYVDRSECSCL